MSLSACGNDVITFKASGTVRKKMKRTKKANFQMSHTHLLNAISLCEIAPKLNKMNLHMPCEFPFCLGYFPNLGHFFFLLYLSLTGQLTVFTLINWSAIFENMDHHLVWRVNFKITEEIHQVFQVLTYI